MKLEDEFKNKTYGKNIIKIKVDPKMAVFWVVASCCLVEVYRRFRDAYCLHHQGDAENTEIHKTTRLNTSHLNSVILKQ
jgi:hypothetical protein